MLMWGQKQSDKEREEEKVLRYTWEGETMRYRCDTLGWSWVITQARNLTGRGETRQTLSK